MVDIDDFTEFYTKTFGSKKNQILSETDQKRLDAVAGYLRDPDNAPWVATVEVIGARVPIETVEVYGLEITVDANGNAVHISSPHGFHTDGVA
jgi:hypothetical protein